MEILFELLFETVGQLLLEVLAEAGLRPARWALRNRVARWVLGAGVAVVAGFVGGVWWGARLTEAGRTQEPRTVWVSLVLASVFSLAAIVVWARRRTFVSPTDIGGDWRLRLLPWRWPPGRLLIYSLLNLSVAAGVAAGFDPRGV
jgi:hypothetical protein